MAKTENITVKGVVTDIKPGATFIVTLENGNKVLSHLCGKIKMNFIKVVAGDNVTLELSPYDLTRGRITRRD